MAGSTRTPRCGAFWAFAELGDGKQAAALFNLINPVYRSDTREKMDRYKVEPYVISADVYGVAPHVGRGGWTWYTGSSGWMYRLGIEAILGVHLAGEALRIDPRIPPDWPGYELVYRFGTSHYQIHVENPNGVSRGVKQMTLDDSVIQDGIIPLRDDGQQHKVLILMG